MLDALRRFNDAMGWTPLSSLEEAEQHHSPDLLAVAGVADLDSAMAMYASPQANHQPGYYAPTLAAVPPAAQDTQSRRLSGQPPRPQQPVSGYASHTAQGASPLQPEYPPTLQRASSAVEDRLRQRAQRFAQTLGRQNERTLLDRYFTKLKALPATLRQTKELQAQQLSLRKKLHQLNLSLEAMDNFREDLQLLLREQLREKQESLLQQLHQLDLSLDAMEDLRDSQPDLPDTSALQERLLQTRERIEALNKDNDRLAANVQELAHEIGTKKRRLSGVRRDLAARDTRNELHEATAEEVRQVERDLEEHMRIRQDLLEKRAQLERQGPSLDRSTRLTTQELAQRASVDAVFRAGNLEAVAEDAVKCLPPRQVASLKEALLGNANGSDADLAPFLVAIAVSALQQDQGLDPETVDQDPLTWIQDQPEFRPKVLADTDSLQIQTLDGRLRNLDDVLNQSLSRDDILEVAQDLGISVNKDADLDLLKQKIKDAVFSAQAFRGPLERMLRSL